MLFFTKIFQNPKEEEMFLKVVNNQYFCETQAKEDHHKEVTH